jgi:hypothetical protein
MVRKLAETASRRCETTLLVAKVCAVAMMFLI